MGFQALLFAAFLALLHADSALAMPQNKNPLMAMCQCDDVSMPECPTNFLAGRSLCHCKNQRELACWKLQWNQANCPSPLPWACDDLDRAGNPKGRVKPQATAGPSAASTFKPTYRGESGLNCVDLGYCYRPTKARTTVVVSVSTGGSVTITVPVGLPSDALPTTTPAPVVQTSEPEIVFTQERWREEVPTRTIV